VAELRLKHAAGIVSYYAFADADERGRFAIRFPVPTRMVTGTLRSSRALRVQRPGLAIVELELPEPDVLNGSHVSVPDAEAEPSAP
jgi:hypothetical protein